MSEKRTLHKLSARRVATETKPGRLSDGGGLYVVVSTTSSRKWLFTNRWNDKQREMGLGSASGPTAVSLADARSKAAACRQEIAAGRDPIETRRLAKASAVTLQTPTFGEFAERYIAGQRPSWRNAKHAQQWVNTLATYAASLRDVAVDQIGRDDVLAVLRPVWQAKNETASRPRGRLEVILDAAKAEGLCDGEDPAGWEGWPAAGFVDTEIRCLTELESGNAEKEVQPRVQA